MKLLLQDRDGEWRIYNNLPDKQSRTPISLPKGEGRGKAARLYEETVEVKPNLLQY